MILPKFVYAGNSVTAPLVPTTTVAAETAHNTSANAAYNQTNFAANFGSTTWVNNTGTTIAVDPTKTDLSLNPITPGHVSQTSVKTLCPNFTGRWYTHFTPWFRAGGGGGHVDIGVNNDSTAWVAAALTQIKAMGFDGITINWKFGSYQDTVTLLIQSYLATNPILTYCIQIDPADYANTSDLTTHLAYIHSTYGSDVNYQKISGKPVVHFFNTVGGVNYTTAKAAGGFAWYFVMQGSGQLSQAYADAVFDWVQPYATGVPPGDPYNATAATSFLTAVHSSAKGSIPAISPGFNGMLTATTAWSKGKYMPRDSGKCWLTQAALVNANIPTNCIGIHVPTYNDWEEGSSIEGGIENDITVDAIMSGSNIEWSISGGTGDESTILRYDIMATADGVNSKIIASQATGGVNISDLASIAGLGSSALSVSVIAVGRGGIRSHVSGVVTYTPATPTELIPTWPPINKTPFDVPMAVRHDTVSIAGGRQSILERIDYFQDLNFDNVPFDDLADWQSFFKYALTGAQFDYFPDSTQPTHGVYVLEDTAWQLRWKSVNNYTFNIKIRAVPVSFEVFS